MGATTFMRTGKGKTCQDAYRDAYEAANFETGHAGYTGDLNVKSGYVEMVGVPSDLTAEDVFSALSEWDFDNGEEPVKEFRFRRKVVIETWEITSRWCATLEEAQGYVTATATGSLPMHGDRKYKKQGEWELVPVETPPESEWQKRAREAKAKLRVVPQLERYAEIFDDKWGPALAVKTGDGQWAFMGYASC
jgi:hypothetical protein